MNWNRKVMTMVLLVATLLTTGVAAMPATLSSPTLPTVIATANPGELLITWDAVPDAQHYTVGYANLDELEQMTEAGRSALDAFYYVTIGAAHTVHTLNGLGPGIDYYVLVGAQTKRFGADDLVWGPWSSAVRTAEASCPTTETTTQQCVSNGTCLPIREIGRVSGTGDSTEHVFDLQAGLYRFTLTGDVLVYSRFGRYHGRKGLFVTSTTLVETSSQLKNWLPLTPMTPGLSYWRSMQAMIVGNSTSYALAASQKYCCHETLRDPYCANPHGPELWCERPV